ncbi:PREDICTED: ATP-sensitive inward rectifier potassium channel 11-like [Priapulus caudatus]|uniref:ATP-sensitive inward rectifier potassium channel 11-like n=1 Tax=Priapulus caudatus TaxID=37621 RepID=A0ABM1EYF9_PRICU|nr:PREDICTED: ATP-sensitive inward rectifier potassium channel 11-like [Priapulus caudatus]
MTASRTTIFFAGRRRVPHHRRVANKNGSLNVDHSRKDFAANRRYLSDLFTTMVEMQWRWTILVFALGFLVSWIFFAVVYYVAAYAHGDFTRENLAKTLNGTWTPCIVAHFSFTETFLFSLETQHTIGYGSRSITEECPLAILSLICQSIFGVLIQSLVVGMVFAKATRPKKRAQTLMFSKTVVVNMRDGRLCIEFRVGDVRRSQLIDVHMHAVVVMRHTSREGELKPLYRHKVKLSVDACSDEVFMLWPVEVTHRVDADSPFYSMTRDDFARRKFEMIVSLGGVIASTGQTTQGRTSYLNGEVRWGETFSPLVQYDDERRLYKVDFARFDDTYPTPMTGLSAKQYSERRAAEGGEPEEDAKHGELRRHSHAACTGVELLRLTPGADPPLSEDEEARDSDRDRDKDLVINYEWAQALKIEIYSTNTSGRHSEAKPDEIQARTRFDSLSQTSPVIYM